MRHYEFVQYDDPEYVQENRTVQQGITAYGLEWALVDSHSFNYHPVTWLSHMLDCQLFGVNPGAHHLVNVLIHSTNAALLFLALRMMTGAFWQSFFVAALFAWHPLRVESVAWISERKDVLSGLFFFLTLLAYAKYVKSKTQIPKSKVSSLAAVVSSTSRSSIPSSPSLFPHHPSTFFWLSVGFFALGLLSKAMLVTVPFVLLLLDFWPLRRVRAPGQRFAPFAISHLPCAISRPSVATSSGRGSDPQISGAIGQYPTFTLRQLLKEKVPFFVLSLFMGLITFLAQRSEGAVVSLHSETMAERVATMLAGYLGYLRKCFWPHDLSFLYLRTGSIPAATIAVAVITLFAVTALCAPGLGCPSRSTDRKSACAVGWFWFLIMLLPVCGLVQVGPQLMADRYSYLPGAGLAIMVAWSVASLSRVSSVLRGPVIASCAAILLACITLTRQQIECWQNTQTLMTHALQIDPNNYVAHQDLAVYLAKQGDLEAARAHRERVLELDPFLRRQRETIADR